MCAGHASNLLYLPWLHSPSPDLPTYHSLTYQVLGTPSEEDLASIANAQAVQFLRTLPIKPKRCVSIYVE